HCSYTRISSHYILVLFIISVFISVSFFFFNDTATTEIYTLSLHDALPILETYSVLTRLPPPRRVPHGVARAFIAEAFERLPLTRSEEHTSELQSPCNLVCRLLLEKKKENDKHCTPHHVNDIARDVPTRHSL